jgi:dipeptidase E
MKQIIAIGGGGFGRNPSQRIIEKYIIDQSSESMPNVLFIPTASAEDKSYIVNFYSCFNGLNCNPSHLNLFQRTPRIDALINSADVIYIGGGNTKSMLAVWKEWKLDKLLIKAYKKGTILSGVSAGAICWFDTGITDSWASNLNYIDCMGILPGSCCPHYDSEKDRRPSVHKFIEEEKIQSVHAIEDGAAIHFIDNIPRKNLSFREGSNVFYVDKQNSIIREKPQKMVSI